MNTKDEFCENIRLCEKAMYHLAFSLMGNDADAGDVISESIYRAYKNLNTLKQKSAFKAWILQIVHNTAVETIRKNSKIIPLEEFQSTTIYNEECDITTRITVQEAIKNLKQPYRTVIILYYYENLSIIDISHITNTSIVSVKKAAFPCQKNAFRSFKGGF